MLARLIASRSSLRTRHPMIDRRRTTCRAIHLWQLVFLLLRCCEHGGLCIQLAHTLHLILLVLIIVNASTGGYKGYRSRVSVDDDTAAALEMPSRISWVYPLPFYPLPFYPLLAFIVYPLLAFIRSFASLPFFACAFALATTLAVVCCALLRFRCRRSGCSCRSGCGRPFEQQCRSESFPGRA
jgi:hypothetical protein